MCCDNGENRLGGMVSENNAKFITSLVCSSYLRFEANQLTIGCANYGLTLPDQKFFSAPTCQDKIPQELSIFTN